MKPRIVLLGADGDSCRILYHYLARTVAAPRVLLERRESKVRYLKRRIKRLGVGQVAGQIAFRVLLEPKLARGASARISALRAQHGMSTAPIPADRVTRVASMNSSDARHHLKALAPDVVVVSGTRILGKPLLEAVEAPFLNIHAGITPAYRGVHGGYWALVDQRPEACGVTVHLVDEGIDTGNIIAQATIQPTSADSYATYPTLQLAAALAPLRRAIEDALTGTLRPMQPRVEPAPLRTHPTLIEYLRYRRRLGVR